MVSQNCWLGRSHSAEKGRDKKHEARNGKARQEHEQVDDGNGDGKKKTECE
jgi:hypothetical protein